MTERAKLQSPKCGNRVVLNVAWPVNLVVNGNEDGSETGACSRKYVHINQGERHVNSGSHGFKVCDLEGTRE